ncbi:MAG: thiol:disulfide interchange protein DsbA/DsbL [Chromatiaceae bacterium]
MVMTRRDFHAVLTAALGMAVVPGAWAWAWPWEDWVEGRDWEALPAPGANTQGQAVRVSEFFSYGCPHCADLNPLITAWAKELPDDVEFERVPVTFGRAAWTTLARLYYALELGGFLERLDQAVFDAINKQRENLYTERKVMDWVAKQGLDPEAFHKQFNSSSVESKLRQAQASAERFRVNSVPSIIVDERYRVIGDAGRGHEGQLDIAAGMIRKAREASRAGT